MSFDHLPFRSLDTTELKCINSDNRHDKSFNKNKDNDNNINNL